MTLSLAIPLWLIIAVCVVVYVGIMYVASIYCSDLASINQPWAGLMSLFWPVTVALAILAWALYPIVRVFAK